MVQLAVTVLIALLISALALRQPRRRYCALWAIGWWSLVFALSVIVARHPVLTWLLPADAQTDANPEARRAFHAAYQTGKFGFLVLLALGSAVYGRIRLSGPWPVALAALALLLGATGWTGDLNRAVLIQSFLAVPVFLGSAVLVGQRQPHGSPARRILIVALAGLAVLWALYIPLFWSVPASGDASMLSLARYNPYFDAVFSVLLAFGMATAVMEDDHVDAEAAQRQQLDAVARSERRLAEILRVAHDGIVTLDGERRVTALNRAAEQMFGAGLTEGADFDRWLHPDERTDFWELLAGETRRSEAFPPVALRHEVLGLRSDGSTFPLELAVTSDEGAGGFVMVARDLTVEHRTRMEREQLQQQVAQAARLEAVGRMVSGVAHELNNPLTAITAFAQDLQLSARTEEDAEALSVIVQQAQRCRVIVGDLLIFSRSRREERRRVDPVALVRRVLRVFERDASTAGVSLEVRVADDLPAIEIDSVGVEQVLTNLLTNALQAADRGGVITLDVRPTAHDLEFIVEDTGPGIPEEVMPRLFEPFFTTKEQGRGTGLGLAVSHGIAQQHDGSLEGGHRADGSRGARFVLRLPFVDRRAEARGVDEIPPVRPTGADRSGRRVLVVDDEAAIRAGIRRALERRGWSVDEAADGNEALLRLEVGGRLVEYDAMVTDLRMPGLSGVELCRYVEASYPEFAARVIIITGDTATETIAEFLSTTTRPSLQKPFDMRALIELLDQVTGSRHG